MGNDGKGLGWLQKYLKYTEESESPTEYHLWSAFTILAHTLGRKVWLDRGYFNTYPGQFLTILVGPSGSRKSTAINIACDILKETGQVNFLPTKLSAQALIESLVQGSYIDPSGVLKPRDSTGFIKASELSVFLPKMTYVEEIVPTITDIYDSTHKTWTYRTKSGGTIELFNPILSMLTGSTPDWLVTNIPLNAHGGGFLARIFIVYKECKAKSIPFPQSSPGLKRLRNELIAELMLFQQFSGEVKWSPEARVWYEDYYMNKQKKKEDYLNKFEEGYFSRRAEHLLRVAICIAVSQHRTLELFETDLIASDENLKIIEANMSRSFELIEDTNLNMKFYRKIIEFIEQNHTVRKGDIQKHMIRQIDALNLSGVLHTMSEAGLIELVMTGGKMFYKIPEKGKE